MSGKIAIVLARSGSKRLPRKNILQLGGKPMLAWTVEAAVQSGCFQRVLVSTDDQEIAEVGRHFGAEVPFLRAQATDDMASASQATLVALEQAEEHWGEKYQVVAQLMANCPLRNRDNVVDSVRHFESIGAPSQISAFRFGWMNPWWAAKIEANGLPEYLFPEARGSRSQDLPALYCPSGALWIADRDKLAEAGTFYMQGHRLYPMDWVNALDIDDGEDLAMARACVELRGKPA